MAVEANQKKGMIALFNVITTAKSPKYNIREVCRISFILDYYYYD